MRKTGSRRSRKEKKDHTYLLGAGVAGAVGVLILAIIAWGGFYKQASSDDTIKESNAATVSDAEAPEPEVPDYSSYPLKQDEGTALTELIDSYCKAHMESDVELLAEVFDITLSEDQTNEHYAQMNLVRKFLEGYENIKVYYVEGPEPDSFMIFPYFEMKFKGAEQLMPSLTSAYVRKNEAGKYYIYDRYLYDEQLAGYVFGVKSIPALAELKHQIDEQKNQALREDARLAELYQSMSAGADSSDAEVIIDQIGGSAEAETCVDEGIGTLVPEESVSKPLS